METLATIYAVAHVAVTHRVRKDGTPMKTRGRRYILVVSLNIVLPQRSLWVTVAVNCHR